MLNNGIVISHKLIKPGNKSETFLRVELESGAKSFKISAYNVGASRLDQISNRLKKGTKVKAWISCIPEWKCNAYRLFINNEEVFGLETVACYHHSIWIRMIRGLLIISLVGIIIILLELFLRKAGITKVGKT